MSPKWSSIDLRSLALFFRDERAAQCQTGFGSTALKQGWGHASTWGVTTRYALNREPRVRAVYFAIVGAAARSRECVIDGRLGVHHAGDHIESETSHV